MKEKIMDIKMSLMKKRKLNMENRINLNIKRIIFIMKKKMANINNLMKKMINKTKFEISHLKLLKKEEENSIN